MFSSSFSLSSSSWTRYLNWLVIKDTRWGSEDRKRRQVRESGRRKKGVRGQKVRLKDKPHRSGSTLIFLPFSPYTGSASPCSLLLPPFEVLILNLFMFLFFLSVCISPLFPPLPSRLWRKPCRAAMQFIKRTLRRWRKKLETNNQTQNMFTDDLAQREHQLIYRIRHFTRNAFP